MAHSFKGDDFGEWSLADFVASATASDYSRNLLAYTLVLGALGAVEGMYGFSRNSLGLIADAMHVVFHCCAMAISLFGAVQSRRRRSFRHSYGFDRYAVLAAFTNSLMMLFVCLFILTGALHRLIEPAPFQEGAGAAKGGVKGGAASTSAALLFGVLGLLLNIGGVAVLGPGQGSWEHVSRFRGMVGSSSSSSSSSSASGTGSGGGAASSGGGGGGGAVNARAVYLHMYADAVSSTAVIVSALAQRLLGISIADTLQSIFVACFTLYIAVPLFTATGNIMLQTNPLHLRGTLERCRREVLAMEGVLEVSDERWWTQSPGHVVGAQRRL
jgi:cation diffusion facilitator family transporter